LFSDSKFIKIDPAIIEQFLSNQFLTQI